MKHINEISLAFPSKSANEAFARSAVAAFAAQLDPTLDELNDIKTAVSEAVTNCIVHAYPDSVGKIHIRVRIFEDNTLEIVVKDTGAGIPDIDKARTPMFTTGDSERSGMGFTIMESFMDKLQVRSKVGRGTAITMEKADFREIEREERILSSFQALLNSAQAGDKSSCERLVIENSGLIWSIVRRYTGQGVDTDDLYQLGCIGLLKAIQGFDMTLGNKFSTYAVPKIAGEIRRFLRDDGTIKVSRCLKENSRKIRIIREQLLLLKGVEPHISEIAAETGLTPEEIAEAESATGLIDSLDRETNDEGQKLEEFIGNSGIEENILEKLSLSQAISSLKERDKSVIYLRYFKGLTQDKTSKILGISQVQVSRIERSALVALKSYINNENRKE